MSKPKSILFPVGGLNRAFAFQSQLPYTCIDALNVRTIGTETARARGGSRPGMLKAHPTQEQIIYYGSPQNLNTVRPAAGLNEANFHDTFDGLPADSFISNPPWFDSSPYLKAIIDSDGSHCIGVNASPGVIASAIYRPSAQFDTSQRYRVGIQMKPHSASGGPYKQARWSILLRASSGYLSSILDGTCRINLYIPTNGSLNYNLSVFEWNSNNQQVAGPTYSGALPGHQPTWVEVRVVNNKTCYVYVSDQLVLEFNFAVNLPNAGDFVGFELQNYANVTLVDEFNFDYRLKTRALDLSKSYLTLIGNRELYTEDSDGLTMSQSGDGPAYLSNRYTPIETTEWGGRLWIADYGPVKASSVDGFVNDLANGAGRYFQDKSQPFTNVDISRDVVYIKNRGFKGSIQPGGYSFYTISSSLNRIGLAYEFLPVNETGIDYEIRSAMKVYNPLTGRLEKWLAPVPCPLITTYRDRIVVAGNPPHVFYMSRAGNPNDWNFGADPNDPGRAVGGTTGEAGKIGKPITALASFTDDFLVIGCKNELWVVYGDMTAGGAMLNVSSNVGIVGPRAWCRTPEGAMVFMSHNGLYLLEPGGGSRPRKLSDRIPQELRSYAIYEEFTPTLAWDNTGASPSSYGVHILLGPSNWENKNWYYDFKNDAFWEVLYQDALKYPFAVCQHSLANPQAPGLSLAMAGRDGLIRFFSDSVSTDDESPYPSHVLLGPFKEGATLFDSLLDKLVAVMGEMSGPVNWSIFSGPNAESAYEKYRAGTPTRTGSWGPGRNKIDIPRVRGVAHYLLIQAPPESIQGWEMDEIIGTFQALDVYRPL